MRRRRHLRTLAVAGASLLGAALFALVPAAGAHVDSPTVTALHAFVGDPLFGLDTTEGTLFSIEDDEQTAQASTTKLMTFDLTLHAIDDGVVTLADQVVVDAFAASLEPPNSVMADINNVTLEPGEIVSLETLIRGMMYPSGNDAAWAIAFHVAQGYGDDTNGDTVIDGLDFVERMNQHAATIGLTDTQFANANGWDDPAHFTTAQELAETIDHGLSAHSYFGEVIGFSGTYTDTSQGPNGTKTYSWGWGFGYPGWEGHKGGGTTNCNGPNQGCQAISAKRIARRVVATFMQGTFGDEPGMFDFGFGQIFHPDDRGSSSTSGNAEIYEVVCASSSRCLTAALPDSGDVEVVSWAPDVDSSSIAILDEEQLPKSGLPPKGNGQGQGPEGDVALTRLSSGAIIVANRKGSSVDLSRWSMDGGGALSLLDDNIKMGPATTMDLQPVYSDMFLSAATNPDGVLVVKSWRLDGSSLVELDKYEDSTRFYTEVAAGVPGTSDLSGHEAVTVALTSGVMVHDTWAVDETTGEISLMGELVQGGLRDGVGITPFFVNTVFDGELFPPAYYATTFRSGGVLGIRYYRIGLDGTPIQEGASTGTVVEEAAAAPLGIGGLMVASREADGTVQLDAWEARRNDDNSISPDVVSQHTAPAAASLELARVPSTHADGDYVTGVTDLGTGNLQLRAYRSGDRPF